MNTPKIRKTALAIAGVCVLSMTGVIMAAEAPGTYQRSVSKNCRGACNLTFPPTDPSRILRVDQINCLIMQTGHSSTSPVQLTTDKGDGSLVLPVRSASTVENVRHVVVWEQVRYMVTPDARMKIDFWVPSNLTFTQNCLIVGTYL
jgi:hypothetical protein